MLLESSRTFPEQLWEAVIWHNAHGNGEWHELRLQEQAAKNSPVKQLIDDNALDMKAYCAMLARCRLLYQSQGLPLLLLHPTTHSS